MPLHMHYAFWMMVIGTILVIIAFIGLAFRQNSKVERGDNTTETNGQGKFKAENVSELGLKPKGK
jgi:Na+/H+ antiporter NhaC